MKADNQGRIIQIEDNEDPEGDCHSVCNSCKKDMPICWDVVCCNCKRTFCYECSRAIKKKWYCLDCYAVISLH